MSDQFVLKKAINVSEMAQAVGLSRARFYQLVHQGIFPPPEKEPTTGRPMYSEEKQRICLEVRQGNCGIDGQPILFNRKRSGKRRQPKTELNAPGNEVIALLEGLKHLGLSTATASLVTEVRNQLYPNGTADVDHGAVLKGVFLEIDRRISSANAGG